MLLLFFTMLALLAQMSVAVGLHAKNDHAVTNIVNPVVVDVLANDEGAVVELSVIQPPDGLAFLNADRTITYTPNHIHSQPPP